MDVWLTAFYLYRDQNHPGSPVHTTKQHNLNTVKMGCGMSTEEKEGKQRNEEIENQLKRDKLSQRNEIKMLLLGRHHGLLRRCKS